jgi:hypothetical protein
MSAGNLPTRPKRLPIPFVHWEIDILIFVYVFW